MCVGFNIQLSVALSCQIFEIWTRTPLLSCYSLTCLPSVQTMYETTFELTQFVQKRLSQSLETNT